MCCETPPSPVITVEGLHKTFRLYRRPGDRLRELFRREPLHRNFTALDSVSFVLERGQTVGIIGENGSGKSTLLKIIAGVLLPDSGILRRCGKITGLLELGTGFNSELTGEENIFLNGTYLNLSRELIEERKKDIIAFSELGKFIYEPIKNYSSGMVMRLAFSIAIHADPQCFIIDEALSVGDVYFQQKCFQRLREFKKNGGSILFVSHDMNAVKLLCDKAMLLDHGVVRAHGDPDDVVNLYNKLMAGKTDTMDMETGGYGNAAVRIENVRLMDTSGNDVKVLCSGQGARVEFDALCCEDTANVSFGILIRDRFGQDVFGVNGSMRGKLLNLQNGEEHRCAVDVDAMNLGAGLYTVTLAAHTGDTHLDTCFHWIDNAASFEVVQSSDALFSGHTLLDVTLHFPFEEASREDV